MADLDVGVDTPTGPDPQRLWDLLSEADEITIVCHNNPDPDCLASALALGRIAAAAGIDERRILYSGSISHQQNRAFVNLLEVELLEFDAEKVTDRPEDSLLAFVDHSVPGVNNEVPEGTLVDVVVDHHPAENVQGRYVDHREGIGASATILTEYLRALDVETDGALATALLFAIRRETLGFLRGATTAEYLAGAFLHPTADRDLLRRLSSPAVSGATVDAIADAISNREVRGAVLISHVGRTRERDALPQAADYLATLEGIETAIVFGIIDDAIQISGRSTDARTNIGQVLHDAFEGVGSAGGHREMAGGEIPLGIFAGEPDDDHLVRMVERVVTNRLVDALNLSDVDHDWPDEEEED
ncbi:bifunctional oligoribonuclease/PAP phosphatase NrnA [Salinirubellus salinus]|uniref:Bifunctional oligoribonuclease/PAP phosphatase NrnA n=1 Tax=Salinirubellus salinus TaxID=1364945 RepID=A0A9E7R5L5_9EURY|nr:bifunctional oligoribonuclease/PAP phosphatase NrnA [Salinirubellus salinus]UWM55629.1 bifunctional oligoribonuclease/PAP phosphatase NrnA [Salinirubellus salinus]